MLDLTPTSYLVSGFKSYYSLLQLEDVGLVPDISVGSLEAVWYLRCYTKSCIHMIDPCPCTPPYKTSLKKMFRSLFTVTVGHKELVQRGGVAPLYL